MDWRVRTIHPRIKQYQFTTKRNDLINAKQFKAYLVGANPSEYVQATVPLSFKDESKLTRASKKLLHRLAGTFKKRYARSKQ